MAGKKRTAANLDIIAASMPVIWRSTVEYHRVDGIELIDQGHTEQDGEKIVAGQNYTQNMPVKIAINHKRNLKKWFDKYGLRGIEIYCTNVKRWDLKQKKDAENLLITPEVKPVQVNKPLTLIEQIRGFIRCRIWRVCPRCNSDAPEKYECKVCDNFYGYATRSKCKRWWIKFKNQ